MSQHWKEPYSVEAARRAGVHTTEGSEVIGEKGAEWIYHVRVCSFTFAFFSIDMLREYHRFYSTKVLPGTALYSRSPYSNGPAASVGDGQTPFERLPLRLRKESKRLRVVTAFERALADFESGKE